MKSDLEYFYVSNLDSEIRVMSDIQMISLYLREDDQFKNWKKSLMLSSGDARELAELLIRSADHHDELRRSEK